MTFREAVDALERLGSDCDPVQFRGHDTTPRDMLGDRFSPGPEARACDVRLGYWAMGPRGLRFVRGSLSGMVADRRRPVAPPS